MEKKNSIRDYKIPYIMDGTGMIAWICTLASSLFNYEFRSYIINGNWRAAAYHIGGTWFLFIFCYAFIGVIIDAVFGERKFYQRLGKFQGAFVASVLFAVFAAILWFSMLES